jgi:myo-inositol-1(or 4)-monophosphatase
MQPKEILDVALAAAREAVAVHRAYLGTVTAEQATAKGVADFVTHVDRDAERCIVERIRTSFPGHAILAEEGASSAAATSAALSSEWVWVVDPLDGTTNFLHRYPMYAASVAVLHRGELLAGAVVSGASGEEWCAVRGGGAFKDGKRIVVSRIERLDQSLIGTGFPFKVVERLPEYTAQFSAVLRRVSGIRRAGAAAIDLCHVATGYFDGFWELSLAPWDVAAGVLIIREAGGVVTRIDGNSDVIGPGSILAGNPVIHSALGRVVREANPGVAGEAA